MPYCTIDDVKTSVGGDRYLRELSDWDENTTADTTVIDSIIAEADAWIDSFLSKRYDVPVAAPLPRLLVNLSANECAYILRRNRSMLTEADQMHHDERKEMLEDISRGRVTLGVLAQPGRSSLVVDKAYSRNSSKSISRKKLWGFS